MFVMTSSRVPYLIGAHNCHSHQTQTSYWEEIIIFFQIKLLVLLHNSICFVYHLSIRLMKRRKRFSVTVQKSKIIAKLARTKNWVMSNKNHTLLQASGVVFDC